MGLIESIYNGDLFPCEQTNEYRERVGTAHSKVCEAEEKLLKAHPELHDEIDELIAANIHLSTEGDLSEYVKGFRHGALLMLEILRDQA